MKKKYCAVGYTRTASKEDNGDNQKEKIREFCERENLELLRIISDIGISGLSKDRKGLQELVEFVGQNKGKVSALVVTDLSRISRSAVDAISIVKSLNEAGVEIKCVSGQTIDRNFGLSAIPDPASNRTKEGIRHARINGRFSNKAPFGYINGRDDQGNPVMLIDDKKAEIIRAIFREYLSGTPLSLISDKVRKMGFERAGKEAITRILANGLYAGLIKTTNVDSVSGLVKGIHQPIFSEKDYRLVQDKLKSEPIGKRMKNRMK